MCNPGKVFSELFCFVRRSLPSSAQKPTSQTLPVRRMAEAGTSDFKPKDCVATKDKKLRDMLAVEIENKTRACSNASYHCSVARVEGYKFCIMHILQDPLAPYTNCAYTYPLSGHRCTLAAPRHDRQKNKHFSNYCFEHSRLFQLTKTRNVTGKMQRPDTVEAHLGNLTHYVRLKQGEDEDEDVDVEGMSKDPLSKLKMNF